MGLFFLFIIGCALPQPVILTPEGAQVVFIGSDLAQSLPGRPLDKCKILGHIDIQEPPQMDAGAVLLGIRPRCKTTTDLQNLLRNDAASKKANTVIFTTFTPGGMAGCWIGVRGIAILCDDATLEAAGFKKQ